MMNCGLCFSAGVAPPPMNPMAPHTYQGQSNRPAYGPPPTGPLPTGPTPAGPPPTMKPTPPPTGPLVANATPPPPKADGKCNLFFFPFLKNTVPRSQHIWKH